MIYFMKATQRPSYSVLSTSDSHAPRSGWDEILDDLKHKEGIASDAKLASALGVTRGYLCSVRKGRKGISLQLAQTIFSRLGRAIDSTDLQNLFVPVKIRAFAGNLAARRVLVVKRANGHCQLCGCTAPFHDSQGNPYLEIHFVIALNEGGSDSIDNLVTLCPNCHRKMEVNPTEADKKKLQKLAEKYRASG